MFRRIKVPKNANKESYVFVTGLYGCDKNFVFYAGRAIKGSDGPSFRCLDDNFVVDKNNVYYMGVPLKGVDRETFTLDFSNSDYNSEGYARDKNHVYFYDMVVDTRNPEKFEVLRDFYSKDDESVFYNGKKIEGSHGATFELLDNGFARDKNFVYIEGKIVKGSHGPSLKVVLLGPNSPYAIDNCYIYGCTRYKNKILTSIDGETFEILDKYYACDKNFVYYKFKKIPNSEPSTFEVLNHAHYPLYTIEMCDAFDRNFLYLNGKPIKKNPNTFSTFL